MKTRADRITRNERRLLEGLTVWHPDHGPWWTPRSLIFYAIQQGRFAGMSPAGLHQTAASCVRKGFAERMKREGARSPVEYRITSAGRDMIRPASQSATARRNTR